MIDNKMNFQTLQSIDGNQGIIIDVGSVVNENLTITDVCLVEDNFNLQSVSKLCDNEYPITFDSRYLGRGVLILLHLLDYLK
jgi:hypothetical protein